VAASYHVLLQDETFEEFEQAAEDNPEIYAQRLVRLWGPVEAERIVEESVSEGT
jgi:hypothetical protein